MSPDPILIDAFGAFTLGIIVYFLGAKLTRRFSLLSAYSIPEPVSGGIVAALVALLVVVATGRVIEYDLAVRDLLLVYFFTTVGLNARVSDLMKGGPILAVLLGLTLVFMLVQNSVGALGAMLFGLPSQAGVLMGTASLIGGHGTAIAWGPTIASDYGVVGAAELGIAAATVGLILASVLGGPIAKYLISSNGLTASAEEDGKTEGAAPEAAKTSAPITHVEIMRCILWIHLAIAIGYSVNESLEAAGLRLPLFVPCLISGIFLANVLPLIFKKAKAPSGSQSMDLINEFSLSVFLSMSLMSMELWTLAGSAGVLAVTMLLQAAAAAMFIIFVVFRLMGKNYFAAVLSAGFAGFALGATPTAIANMKAVTQRYGPSPLAFIVLPLISAFFVDLANAFIIKWFLGFG